MSVDAPIEPAHRQFWYDTGSMTDRGEFKQYLHLWCMRGDNPPRSYIHNATVFPWINIWDKPDIEELGAYWMITGFENLPVQWVAIWRELSSQRALVKSTSNGVQTRHGPYWMLLPKAGAAVLAQEMAGRKRAITNKVTREQRHEDVAARVEHEFRRELEQFRVLTPQQEMFDEASRSSEVSGTSVREWDSDTFGRPPRCGKISDHQE